MVDASIVIGKGCQYPRFQILINQYQKDSYFAFFDI